LEDSGKRFGDKTFHERETIAKIPARQKERRKISVKNYKIKILSKECHQFYRKRINSNEDLNKKKCIRQSQSSVKRRKKDEKQS